MAKSTKNIKPVENIPQKQGPESPKRKRFTAKERVKQHMENKHDVITEDDIKNLHLDLDVPKDHAHKPLPITNEDERPHDEDKDHKNVTPWDVIS